MSYTTIAPAAEWKYDFVIDINASYPAYGIN